MTNGENGEGSGRGGGPGERERDLLRALGKLAAEQDAPLPEDRELERFCAGELPAEEVAALEARAAGDPGFARKLAAYRPLDAGFRSRLADRLTPIAGVAPAPERVAAPKSRPRAARHAWRWGAGGATLALAAAWLVWVGGQSGNGNGNRHGPSVALLPSFEIDATGGDREVRGPAPPPTSGAPRVLRPESRLELTLRPATSVAAGAISVDAFLVPATGDGAPPRGRLDTPGPPLELVALPFAISGAGVAHLAGNAGQLFGPRRGRWQLRLLVARADTPPAERARLAAGAATAGAGWQRMDVDLSLVDPR